MDRAAAEAAVPGRLALLDDVLAHLAAGTAEEAARVCALAAQQDPAAQGLAAIADFWLGDFDLATRHATAGLEAATDAESRGLCLAAAALAAAGDVAVTDHAHWSSGVALLTDVPDDPWWACVRYLLAEAALVSARIDDAAAVAAAGRPPADAWPGHPFAPVMLACQIRIAAFAGRIDVAAPLVGQARAAAVAGTRVAGAVDAVASLVLGNAGDAEAASSTFAAADAVPAHPRDFLDRGVLLLLAFGAIALGQVATAAAMTFRAGADEALSRCTIIDRALGLELLLVAALEAGDDDACAAWLAALEPIEAHPIAAPTVTRARARLVLARGGAAQAIELLTASVAACTAQGRRVEAAEGEIVLARARIAARDLGGASRGLRALVVDSDRTGHGAVRRSAGAALSSSGRRLPPVAGAGWAALSAREAEVARAILAGDEVDKIAAALFLSPRTVRVHTSRVLCAFGVATRIGLLAAVGTVAGEPPGRRTPLSPRQAEVAALLAAGLSNGQIATALGISVKGVEKHVGDVLGRWSAGSRFEVARIWWAGAGK